MAATTGSGHARAICPDCGGPLRPYVAYSGVWDECRRCGLATPRPARPAAPASPRASVGRGNVLRAGAVLGALIQFAHMTGLLGPGAGVLGGLLALVCSVMFLWWHFVTAPAARAGQDGEAR